MNNFDILKREITEYLIRAESKETIQVLNHLQEFADGLGDDWISIDDDTPTTDDFVFVLLHGRFPALGKYSNDIWEAQALGSQVLNLVDGARVTHWLPKPQLPKEEADD